MGATFPSPTRCLLPLPAALTLMHVPAWLAAQDVTAHQSQDQAAANTSQLALFRANPDGAPTPDIKLTDDLTLGRRFDVKAERSGNYDLDDTVDEDEFALSPDLFLSLSYQPRRNVEVFGSMALERELMLEAPRSSHGPLRLQVDELYVQLDDVLQLGGGDVSLQIGRQRFADDREWLYDERLDGVRLHYERDELTLELSVTRENDRDLLNDVAAGRTDNYLLYGYWESEEIDVGKLEIEDVLLGGYVLLRDGRAADEEDLQFLGLRTYGELIERFDYWLEAAYVRGTSANRANQIRGYGFDLGGTYRFDLPWRPSITIGYAVGSGDADPEDGTDRAFRQTGLQDNQDSIGKGVMSFRYYGTLLEPELSNLSITTLAFTVKPTEDSSIHLLYHGYRQQRAFDELRDTNLDADPNGDSRDIGSAIDLVFGVDFQRLSVELELGYFMPGAAFDADEDDPAFFMETEFKYRF